MVYHHQLLRYKKHYIPLKNDIEFVKHNENELEHENMVWLHKTELNSVDWLPADIEAVKEYKHLRRIA